MWIQEFLILLSTLINNHKNLDERFENFKAHYHSLAKENLKTILDKPNVSPEAFNEPRGFTVNQFKELFTYCQEVSKLQYDFNKEREIARSQDFRINELENQKRKIKMEIQENLEKSIKMNDDTNQNFNKVQSDNDAKHKSVLNSIRVNEERIRELYVFKEDTKLFEESTVNQTKRLGSLIENNKIHTQQLLKELNSKLQEDFEEIRNDYRKLNDQTYTEVSDQIDKTSRKVIEIESKIKVEWKKTVKGFESTIERFRNELTKKFDTLNESSKSRTKKIKDIWIDYFSKHEENVKEIQGKVSGVTQAFDEWKIYVMNPQSINEARIHSLDIKCDEIEKAVDNNLYIIFGIIKKLLFSLQQQILSHNNPNSLEVFDEEKSYASRQASRRDDSIGLGAELQAKAKHNLDLMFLKRLFHLQNELKRIANESNIRSEIKSAERTTDNFFTAHSIRGSKDKIGMKNYSRKYKMDNIDDIKNKELELVKKVKHIRHESQNHPTPSLKLEPIQKKAVEK